jgi:hypothetical protein
MIKGWLIAVKRTMRKSIVRVGVRYGKYVEYTFFLSFFSFFLFFPRKQTHTQRPRCYPPSPSRDRSSRGRSRPAIPSVAHRRRGYRRLRRRRRRRRRRAPPPAIGAIHRPGGGCGVGGVDGIGRYDGRCCAPRIPSIPGQRRRWRRSRTEED